MQTSAYMCYLLNTWNKQLHEQETTDTQTKHKQYIKTLHTLHKYTHRTPRMSMLQTPWNRTFSFRCLTVNNITNKQCANSKHITGFWYINMNAAGTLFRKWDLIITRKAQTVHQTTSTYIKQNKNALLCESNTFSTNALVLQLKRPAVN